MFWNVYVIWKEKKTLLSKHNIPSAFILLGIVGGAILYSISSEQVVALQDRSKAIENQLKLERQFGKWARLNASGFSLDSADLRVYYKLRPAFQDTLQGQEGPTSVDCGEGGIAILQQTIERYPDFPFSYVYLSACYKDQNNSEWRKYAQEAVSILANTTQISGHHRHHDRMYKLVTSWLEDESS